jgi:hypothetical protein
MTFGGVSLGPSRIPAPPGGVLLLGTPNLVSEPLFNVSCHTETQ